MLICSLIDSTISSDIVMMSAKKRNEGKVSLPITAGVVTEINGVDVLLGRGMPILKMAGNSRFRTLIVNHRDEYRASNRHAFKDEIARRIYLTIRALGGRFLRQIESSIEKERFNIGEDDSAWIVVEEETSLQKIKQALRELPWNAEPKKPSKSIEGNVELKIHTESDQLRERYQVTNLPDFLTMDSGKMYEGYRDVEMATKRRKLNHFPPKMAPRSRDDEFLFHNPKYLDMPKYLQSNPDDLSLRNASIANQLQIMQHQQSRILDNPNERKNSLYGMNVKETQRRNPIGVQGQLFNNTPFSLPIEDSYNPLPRLSMPTRRNKYRYAPFDRSASFPPSMTMRAPREPNDVHYSSMRQGREFRETEKANTSPLSNRAESAHKLKSYSSSNSSSPSTGIRKE